MKSHDLKTRILAQDLRRRLQGRCSQAVLGRMSDEELVEQFQSHQANKLRWLQDQQKQHE